MKSWAQALTPPAGDIQQLSEAIATAIGPLLATAVRPPQRGIYLASRDAGIMASVDFWRAALADSPRFASPADFPWTLANAPAGLLARELGIQGPNHTLVGGADAMLAALEHAYADLADRSVDEAVIIACDLSAAPESQGVAVVLRAPGPALPDNADSAISAGAFLGALFGLD